ncbi:MAG: CoA pyrophosphatase [bacterium]
MTAEPQADRPAWADRLLEASRGLRAQDISPYLVPSGAEARSSAVLILLSDRAAQATEAASVLLLERASTLRQHAGQIAFPGGASDPDDVDATATALREASEEVGLDAGSVDVLTTWPELHLSVTSFTVTPVLARWRTPHPVSAVDRGEVAGVATVPLTELAKPANRFSVSLRSGLRGPGFTVGDLFVWGFTAGLLDALLRLGGWSRAWDASVLRPVPAGLGTVVNPAIGAR